MDSIILVLTAVFPSYILFLDSIHTTNQNKTGSQRRKIEQKHSLSLLKPGPLSLVLNDQIIQVYFKKSSCFLQRGRERAGGGGERGVEGEEEREEGKNNQHIKEDKSDLMMQF